MVGSARCFERTHVVLGCALLPRSCPPRTAALLPPPGPTSRKPRDALTSSTIFRYCSVPSPFPRLVDDDFAPGRGRDEHRRCLPHGPLREHDEFSRGRCWTNGRTTGFCTQRTHTTNREIRPPNSNTAALGESTGGEGRRWRAQRGETILLPSARRWSRDSTARTTAANLRGCDRTNFTNRTLAPLAASSRALPARDQRDRPRAICASKVRAILSH